MSFTAVRHRCIKNDIQGNGRLGRIFHVTDPVLPRISQDARQRVAPELLPGLDLIPAFELNKQVLQTLRSGAITGAREAPPLSPRQQAVGCEQRLLRGAAGGPDVRVLVYTPAGTGSTQRPVYLHLHGGGFVLGAPEINDGANRSLAADLDCIIVSVDYRLAPEVRYPAPVEDCYAALKWLYGDAERLGIDRQRIAVGGESAGAGLAAMLSILTRDRGEVPIRLQLLDSPMLDDRTGTSSDPHPHCGRLVWTSVSNRFAWRAFLGTEPGAAEAPLGAVPARVSDLTGLAPAFIVIGALDLFLEESLEYARRLVRADVPTELHVIPGAFHGFGAAGGEAPQVKTCLGLRAAALARAFEFKK